MIKEMKAKNEELKVYLVEGKMYVIVTKLAEVLEANKADVYNAAARLGKEAVAKYIKVVTLNDLSLSRPTAKCIDVEGLPVLFKKIERKVDTERLQAVAEFLNIEFEAENNSKPKSNIVEFIPTVETEDSKEIKSEEPTVEESTVEENNAVDIQDVASTEVQNDTEMSLEVSAETNMDSVASSNDEAENIIDGILTIIEENKALKEKVASLENTVVNLQEELSKFNGNPLELENLKEENESLRLKLKESEEKTQKLFNKANLIKDYIANNK